MKYCIASRLFCSLRGDTIRFRRSGIPQSQSNKSTLLWRDNPYIVVNLTTLSCLSDILDRKENNLSEKTASRVTCYDKLMCKVVIIKILHFLLDFYTFAAPKHLSSFCCIFIPIKVIFWVLGQELEKC